MMLAALFLLLLLVRSECTLKPSVLSKVVSNPVGFAFYKPSSSLKLARSLQSSAFPANQSISSSPQSFRLLNNGNGDNDILSSSSTTDAPAPASIGLITDANMGEYVGSSLRSTSSKSFDRGEGRDDDAYLDQLFESLAKHSRRDGEQSSKNHFKLVDFIEQNVGIQGSKSAEDKKIRGRAKSKHNIIGTTSADGKRGSEVKTINGSDKIVDGRLGASFEADLEHKSPAQSTIIREPKSNLQLKVSPIRRVDDAHVAMMEEQPPPSVNENREAPYNVVCTHITADFDTLASAIGLAKLWSLGFYDEGIDEEAKNNIVNGPLPTYVVLPRGAHPDVQRFLSLHKHLFPIRSLKSLPGFSDSELKKGKNADHDNPNEGLQRVGLVDAQRRDRLGPAEILLPYAKLGVTIVDHHVDAESDIEQARHYVVERVGSVSTIIAERMKNKGVDLTEAEATILALGIHSDTGSLVYDSTTPKDAKMLGWTMEMGASQMAIAEHAKPTMSGEQQGVLTQALVNINSTTVHGVTISTVLLSADGFIPGLASVTKDALDLSSSDVFLLAVCYEATRGAKGGGNGEGSGEGKVRGKNSTSAKFAGGTILSKDANERLQQAKRKTVKALSRRDTEIGVTNAPRLLPGIGDDLSAGSNMINSDRWKGGEVAFKRQGLAATFAFYDTNRSGFLDKDEILQALAAAGYLISPENFDTLISFIDRDGNGKIDFEEFVHFYTDMEEQNKWDALRSEIEGKLPSSPSTMTIIGRVKAGVNVRNVNLNNLFQKFNGGGHPKAASATAKLEDESEAKKVLQDLVDELIDNCLDKQLTVGDFMQSPVLSAKPTMTEKQVEDLFIRYDVRALPVVDNENIVIGLVSYKEVAAAKMRLMNKQEKRMRQIENAALQGRPIPEERPLESALKGWMKQHVQTVEASQTIAEVESILLETDVGCIPVVMDNTKQLIGMVTRTDILRQHRYYSSLRYHNKGFSDSIAARKPIIELRKKLKKFDVENE